MIIDDNKTARREPQPWWTEDKDVNTVDDLFLEIARITPEAAAMVRIIYQIGAHKFQEHNMFIDMFPNLEKIYLFEPIPELYNHLITNFGNLDYISMYPYAITDFDGEAEFFITNNYESSSLLKLKKHKEVYPHIYESEKVTVLCRKLNTVIREKELDTPDLLFIDVQGAEYKVISSLSTDILDSIKILYTEASMVEFYKDAKNLCDIQGYLKENYCFLGFSPQDNRVRNHGNALFFNKKIKHLIPTTFDK